MSGRTGGLKGRGRGAQLGRVQARERAHLDAATTWSAGATRCASTAGRRTAAGSARCRRSIADIRGRRSRRLIPKIEAAIKSYRYANAGDYRMWPGPNSNTFVATVLRAVPEARRRLPPNAVGRDFRPWPYARPDRQRHRRRSEPVGPARREARLGRGRRGQCAGPGGRPRPAPSRASSCRASAASAWTALHAQRRNRTPAR